MFQQKVKLFFTEQYNVYTCIGTLGDDSLLIKALSIQIKLHMN